jgi:hypothetical protein
MRGLMMLRLSLIRGCVLAALIVLCGWYRWNNGLHYREFLVRVSGVPSLAAKAELFAVRPDGRLTVMQRLPSVENLWVFQNSGPVIGVVAAWAEVVASRDVSFEIRSGGSWTDDAVALQSQVVQELGPVDSVLRAELSRRERAGSITVRPEACAGSIWSGNGGVVNWGGDVHFAATVLTQALLGGIFAELFLGGLVAAAVSWAGGRHQGGRQQLFNVALSQTVRAIFLVVLLIQLKLTIEQLLMVRDAGQYLAGAGIAGALGLLYWGWVSWVSRTASQRRLLSAMLGVGCLILCLKLLWLQTVNAVPCSDYAQYYRLGQQISAGDWDSIGPKQVPLTHLLMRRSLCFSYPITALFGAEISTFEYCNVAAQMLSAAIMSLLVHRIWGLQTAARFLPLVLFVPEFWYSAGIVSHNVWGYLWIPLVWLLADVFVVRTERVITGLKSWMNQAVWAVLIGIALGLGIGMVDLLKHYGPFFVMSIFVVVFFRRQVIQPAAEEADGTSGAGVILRILFLATVIVTSIGFWSRVDGFLRSRSGVTQATFLTNMARLAATETGSSAITTSWTIWQNQFFLRLPSKDQLPLQVRKALHEHLACGLRVWQQYYFKAQLMGVQINAMTIAQDRISAANQEHSIRLVPWSTVQTTIAWLVSGSLMCAGILRLLVISAIPVSSRELFPVLSVVFVMAASFVLTDAHPYTGQNLAFPLCCAIAVLPNCGRWFRKDVDVDWRQVVAVLQIRKLLFGLALFGTLIAAHVSFGMLIDHSGLTFHRIEAVAVDPTKAATETVNIDPAGVRLIGSRIHAGMRLVPISRNVAPGMRVVRHFRVTADRGRLNGLKFLITGNPREFLHGGYGNRGVVLADAWKDLPIRYSVALEGREITSGRLQDLARVKLAEFPAAFWRDQSRTVGGDSGSGENSVLITLTLESDGAADLGSLPWPPSLAVECFH